MRTPSRTSGPAPMLAMLLACIGCGADPQVDNPRPHVVLFIIDTLRADALGSYGFPEDTSPELDALGSQGVMFLHAYSQSSWTRPSIGSMLTGRYPRSIGIFQERQGILPDRFSTLAELLQAEGYRTFGITANPHLNVAFNFHQGFDTYLDSNTGYSFMKTNDGQQKYRAGRVASAPEMFAKAHGFVDLNPGARVYLQFDLMEVHEWSRSRDAVLLRPEFKPGPSRRAYRNYHASLRQVSHDIDEFVADLKRRPGWRDALFVITSDHGEGLGDHPDVGNSTMHGRLLYESQVHVPLILHREGWKHAGTIVEQRVRILDLLPTLLELLGIQEPGDLDGRSLVPVVRRPGSRAALPELFVSETFLRGDDKTAVHGPKFSYFVHRDSHRGLNPIELQVTGIPANGTISDRSDEYPEVVERMAEFLKSWKRRHPPAPTTRGTHELSPRELDQLKALGYVD